MQFIVTIDLLTAYNKHGANPQIWTTGKNTAFIEYLKNADVEGKA